MKNRNSQMLSGKVCLVTGGSRGIGKAIAETFASNGGIVYVGGNSTTGMDEWASEISVEFSTRVIPLYFDICNGVDCKNAIQQIKNEHSRLDVLVNNAGIGYNELIGMISINKMREVFEVNVFGLTNLLQLASKVMVRQKFGSIINISSTVGIKGNPGQLAYAASKGAVLAITKSASKELASSNIRVNSIAPGLVETSMFQSADTKKLEERISRIGMKRLGTSTEIAAACLFLASDSSEYITGQVISVDGGAIL